MENSSVASASSEAGSTLSQEIEELERFIDSYVLEYQVQGLLSDMNENDGDVDKPQSHVTQSSKKSEKKDSPAPEEAEEPKAEGCISAVFRRMASALNPFKKTSRKTQKPT